jgi:hypothetical protein
VVVNTDDYKQIVSSEELPRLATSFLALSYEKRVSHEYPDAAWRAIHAAWACDDAQDDKAAIKCRKKAIELIEQCTVHSQVFVHQAGATESITIDLMRRAGMLKEAKELVEKTKKQEIHDLVGQVISFEEVLIDNRDTGSHTVNELPAED